jgi:hypothetical protein
VRGTGMLSDCLLIDIPRPTPRANSVCPSEIRHPDPRSLSLLYVCLSASYHQ